MTKPTARELERQILDYIDRNGSISYPELEELFEGCGFDYRGHLEVTAGNTEIVYWCGWSQAAHNIIEGLLRARLIEREPQDMLGVLLSGKALPMPIIKPRDVPDNLPTTPHWLPVVFVRRKQKGAA